MKQRLVLGAMLGGSAAFLVSLYFGWIHAAFCIAHDRCLGSADSIVVTDGLSAFGQVATVLAIALAAGAIAAAANKELARRLPLGRAAVGLGIFAVLAISELWASASATAAVSREIQIGLGPGAYIGLAGAGVAGVGAVAARWGEIKRPPRATAVAGQLIALALIASFVLPALNATRASAYEFMNQFQGALAASVCLFAYLALLAWQGGRPGPRLATAAAIGTLVAAELLPIRRDSSSWPYELWLLVACAAGLLLLSVVGSWGLRFRRPAVSELGIAVGSVLLLVSLFLPWQSFRGAGPIVTQWGWSTTEFAGVFALGLLLALVWAGRIVRELAIGAALLVLMAGLETAITHDDALFGLRHEAPPRMNLEYGAFLGFAGAALLLAFSLGRLRPTLTKHSLRRLIPVLAALALLSFEVAPNALNLADILSTDNLFAVQSPFLTLGILSAIAMLSTIRLLLRWVEREGHSAELVRFPLALLALTVLAVIHDSIVTTTFANIGPLPEKGISWEGWVALFLCLLLLACGWVERYGVRLERLRIWRADPAAGQGI